jgi:phosphonate transport system substrate-binding protein
MAYFRENGVHDVSSYFKDHYFAGSHDATVIAVLNGKADVGCAKNTIFGLVAAREPRVEKELVILAQSQKVPSNGLAMRKDLDPATKRLLQDALLGMAEDDAGKQALNGFGAIRFILTTKADYDPVFTVVETAGIELAEYQYRNE